MGLCFGRRSCRPSDPRAVCRGGGGVTRGDAVEGPPPSTAEHPPVTPSVTAGNPVCNCPVIV